MINKLIIGIAVGGVVIVAVGLTILTLLSGEFEIQSPWPEHF